MEIKTLNSTLGVSGQITPEDLQNLHASGVQSIVCNRPNQEEANQPDFDSIAEAAKELGMNTVFMPVVSGQITQADGAAFGKLLNSLPGPVHAYCRSGMRCTTLWALSELAEGRDRATLIEQAKQAGYDLSGSL